MLRRGAVPSTRILANRSSKMSNELPANQRLLHIIANDYFLTRFLLDSVADDALIDIYIHPKLKHGFVSSIKKIFDAHILNSTKESLTLPREYINNLAKIRSNDPVLIFGIDNPKELRILSRFIPSKNRSIFLWNPISGSNQKHSKLARRIDSIKKIGKVFTFDPHDGETFKIEIVNQVYRSVEPFVGNIGANIKWDLYFIGQDKGRLKILQSIEAAATKQGLISNFAIIKDKHRTYHTPESKSLSSKPVDYRENISNVLQSRCLLEILQANQTGPSIRCMEAIFFNKKLITNNAHMRLSELYHPDRILILGDDNHNEIADFLSRPIPANSDELLKKYEFKQWCRQFASEENTEIPRRS